MGRQDRRLPSKTQGLKAAKQDEANLRSSRPVDFKKRF